MEEADRIFDDHDGCESVNVSSGTGSPGSVCLSYRVGAGLT